jgi:hypothetical protein
LQLLANNGPGTPIQPKFFATVTDFNSAERGAVDNHNYVGSQGDEPDKDIAGYGGSGTAEIREKDLLLMEEQIAARQYANEEDLDIRLVERIRFSDGTSKARTYGDCVMTFDRRTPSRAGFFTLGFTWQSGGLPSVE